MSGSGRARRERLLTNAQAQCRRWFLLGGIPLVLLGGAVIGVAAPQQGSVAARPARSVPAAIATSQVLPSGGTAIAVRRINVLRGKTSVEVQIEGSGPLKPVSMLISNPERIVIDLADVSYDRSRRLPVGLWDVEAVRVGMFQDNPPITRVVLDLSRPHAYRVLPAGNTVIVQIEANPREAAPVSAAGGSLAQGAIGFQPAILMQGHKDAAELSPVPPLTGPQASSMPAESSPQGTATATEMAVAAPIPPVATSVTANTAGGQHGSPLSTEEETTPHQAAKANKPGVIRSLSVSREKNAIEVHVQGTKPLRPAASTLSSPERIILDLADARLARPRQITVNSGDVQNVDASLYLVNPLVTRVIVNLARPRAYHLLTSGNSLTLRIETEEVKTAEKPAR